MSHYHHIISRRAFALGAVGAAAVGPRALAQALTANSEMGPFFPFGYRGETDADLTRIAGHANRAQGQVIEVVGRVLDKFGRPINGARLDIWQANTFGKYAHPQDDSDRPLDPDFQGFATINTGSDGSWKLLTVKPGMYGTPGDQRTPHIHMDISGSTSRNIFQMYFPDEQASNAKDGPFKSLGADAPTSIATGLGDHRYSWDIVLFEG
jgi:protocatechuate 3,4-dioxygenase beta subunit